MSEFEDCRNLLDEIRQIAEQLDGDTADVVMTPQERIDVYAAADLAAITLGIVVRKLRHDAAVALADLGVMRGETFDTGSTVVRRTTSRQGGDHWRGWALCDALARTFADQETGELVRAVPVHVMRDAVAGCARDELTSSRWRTEGLVGRVNVGVYHVQRPVSVDDVSIVRAVDPNGAEKAAQS